MPYPPDYGGVFDLYYKLKYLHERGVIIHLHCYEYGRGKQAVDGVALQSDLAGGHLQPECHKLSAHELMPGYCKIFPKIITLFWQKASTVLTFCTKTGWQGEK